MIILFFLAQSVLATAGFMSAPWIGAAANFVNNQLSSALPRDGPYAREIAVATVLLLIVGALGAVVWLALGVLHLRQAESKGIEIDGRIKNERRLAIVLQISVGLILLWYSPRYRPHSTNGCSSSACLLLDACSFSSPCHSGVCTGRPS